ncbi:MAG TPA: DUF5947 family protein [Candidatus Angelobacter sp.]|jgi:hypothetical protein
MNNSDIRGGEVRALLALKQLGRKRKFVEFCELCSRELGPVHPHLIEPVARRIACACTACALLFEDNTTGQYRRIPRDAIRLDGFNIEDVQWENLSIPIGLAFFFFSSAAGRVVAMYPSPGGAMESTLSLEAWGDVAQRHPRLQRMQADVEALLVNRLGKAHEYFLAPIDRCYELTGIVRKHWHGFTGGEEVWREVNAFFDGLRGNKTEVAHAKSAL